MASAEIYYFTGTGNSLSVARMIAECLDGTWIPIASIIEQQEIRSEASAIGIVFPVYFADLPNLVRRFARKLIPSGPAYIFGVATYGGAAVAALRNLGGILSSRGLALDAGFGFHMPQNAFRKPWENRARAYRRAHQRASGIAQRVERRWVGVHYTNRLLQAGIMPFANACERSSVRYLENTTRTPSPSGLTIEDLLPLVDMAYSVTDACTACGLCVKACPVGNIIMQSDRPVWQHRCESCLACFNWCPTDAIRGSVAKNEYRYRHPDVRLQDMEDQRSGPERAWT